MIVHSGELLQRVYLHGGKEMFGQIEVLDITPPLLDVDTNVRSTADRDEREIARMRKIEFETIRARSRRAHHVRLSVRAERKLQGGGRLIQVLRHNSAQHPMSNHEFFLVSNLMKAIRARPFRLGQQEPVRSGTRGSEPNAPDVDRAHS